MFIQQLSHVPIKFSYIYDVLCSSHSFRKPPRTSRRTDRTTMLLVAVLILFLITEFPQGILGLLSAILDQCFFKKCYTLFGEFMDLLALINGAIGFVLYGLMSKQFRTTFKSLFLKKPVDNLELTRVTGTTSCGWLKAYHFFFSCQAKDTAL